MKRVELNKIGDLLQPPEVQRRVKALKNIHLQDVKQKAEYCKEKHQLDLKYQRIYDENNSKRKQIYLGKYEPTDYECLSIGGKIENADDEANKILGNHFLEEKKLKTVKGKWKLISMVFWNFDRSTQ